MLVNSFVQLEVCSAVMHIVNHICVGATDLIHGRESKFNISVVYMHFIMCKCIWLIMCCSSLLANG